MGLPGSVPGSGSCGSPPSPASEQLCCRHSARQAGRAQSAGSGSPRRREWGRQARSSAQERGWGRSTATGLCGRRLRSLSRFCLGGISTAGFKNQHRQKEDPPQTLHEFSIDGPRTGVKRTPNRCELGKLTGLLKSLPPANQARGRRAGRHSIVARSSGMFRSPTTGTPPGRPAAPFWRSGSPSPAARLR